MSMINARGTTNGSAYAMWSVMLYGTCKQTDHGCTSCPTSMLSLRSQPLSSALLLKNKPREQHECTNLMHSDLVASETQTYRQRLEELERKSSDVDDETTQTELEDLRRDLDELDAKVPSPSSASGKADP